MRRVFAYDRFPLGLNGSEIPERAGVAATSGMRMNNGAYVTRPASALLASFVSTSDAGYYLFTAPFPSGPDLYALSGTAATKVTKLVSGAFTGLTGSSQTFNAGLPWAGGYGYGRFYMSQGTRFNAGASTCGMIYNAAGTQTLIDVANSPGAREIVAYDGRLFALNVHDTDGFKTDRVRWSASLTPGTWYASDAGYADLLDDGYPIQRAVVTQGRLIIFRGNDAGGSIVFCSRTGIPGLPYAFETVYTMGLFGRNTLYRLTPDSYAFLSHDNVYLFSGGRAEAIGDPIARYLFTNISSANIDQAFIYYVPETGDLVVTFPTLASTRESVIYNVRMRTWVGPETNTTAYNNAVYFQSTGATAAPDTWDDYAPSVKWNDVIPGDADTWDTAPPTQSGGYRPPALTLAKATATASAVYLDVKTSTACTDLGTSISVDVETSDIDFMNEIFTMPGREGLIYKSLEDLVACDTLFIHYRDYGSANLSVSLSMDGGGTWNSVGIAVLGGANSGRNPGTARDEGFKSIRMMFSPRTGARFRVRLTGASSNRIQITGVSLGVYYVGFPQA